MKTIDIRPVTGFMDTRSNPDEVAQNGYRYVQNVGVIQKNKLCRIPGFDKLLTRDQYNNQDLHDQLTGLTGLTDGLPITFLFQAISSTKATKLIAGTERALYALNGSTGNWRIISDKLGGEGARWRAAQIGDLVIFSNNLDEPVSWNFDQPPTEALDQSVAIIRILSDSLKIKKVGTLIVWKDHLFLMNVVQKGQIRSNRIIWSDRLNPLSWNISDASTAGNADLDYQETILGALELGNSLLIYTNRGIWEGGVSSSSEGEVFTFSRRYNPKDSGENCLFYPNTLVSTGSEHVFAGVDGLYIYNLFQDKPKLMDWMHKSSNLMFDQINRENCLIHIAAYHADRKELLFSYAKTGEDLPSETLVYNTEFPFGHVFDHGFSAMLTYVAHEVMSVRDFVLQNCICTSIEAFDEASGGFVKEGGFCTAQADPDCPEPNPEYLWSDQPLEIEDGIVTEDYTADSSSNSLCAFIDLTLQEICEAESRSDECNSGKRFIAVSVTDNCIKEMSGNYYREMCSNKSGCGTYEKRGYQSILRSGPLAFGNFANEKEIHRFEAEALAQAQTIPSVLELRIGNDAQASDPNFEDCGILWVDQTPKDLQCLSGKTLAQHKNRNTRADTTYDWPLYYIGRFLFWELKVTNPEALPFPDTGGAVCFSRWTVDVNPVGR